MYNLTYCSKYRTNDPVGRNKQRDKQARKRAASGSIILEEATFPPSIDDNGRAPEMQQQGKGLRVTALEKQLCHTAKRHLVRAKGKLGIWGVIFCQVVTLVRRYSSTVVFKKWFMYYANTVRVHIFFYKDQWKKSEPGKEKEIATSKITTMYLNIGHF